jgi:hypothetical protein
MAVTRPLKEGSVTTYQQKVALGFPDILASEMDADLDTIYAAWNGNVGTANLVDGSVTTAKLAPNLQTWQTGAGNPITPIDATKLVAVPGPTTGADQSQLRFGTRTAKGRIIALPTNNWAGFTLNDAWNGSVWVQDDATKPSWQLNANADLDNFQVARGASGGGAVSALLTLDAAGALTLAGTTMSVRSGTAPVAAVSTDGISTGLYINHPWGPTDSTKPSWLISANINPAQDVIYFYHRAANAANVGLEVARIEGAGNFVISGPTGMKSTGTLWANPSDRRLKDEIEDYATGLAAILELQPRTFVYNGKGGSVAGMRGCGFIADEVEPVMPETVSTRAGKLDPDDEDETDIQTLDQSNLILALVNAVKELATRMTAVEAR